MCSRTYLVLKTVSLTFHFQPKSNGKDSRAGTKRKRVMKFSDDEDDELEIKTEGETKVEDEGICLDDDQGLRSNFLAYLSIKYIIYLPLPIN